MSRMRLDPDEEARMSESRLMIRKTMLSTINTFPYKWKGSTYGRLYGVLKMYVNDIMGTPPPRSQTLSAKAACNLAAIMITRLVGGNVPEAMILALGAYIEQEAKKKDQWRDESFTQLYKHLKDEIAEIGRSKQLTIQLHNCMDACALAAMLILKLEE